MIHSPSYWTFRRVSPPLVWERIVLMVLLVAGGLAMARLMNWWFREQHVAFLPAFVLLSLTFWYGMSRVVLGWFNLWRLRVPEAVPAPAGLRVALFTTSSPGEPLAMFEKTLAACARIRYPHTTYLLDDTQDPRFREVAERYGAVLLEIVGEPGAKAGKINKALSLTDEDFILVLDPDHLPFSNFLDRVLGYFTDPKVGFVQVSQAYYNQERSFVAKGAAEQTYTFYGPTQMGLFGHGGAVAIGANCTFRREALLSIGGHGIGLAEDLVTSIRLHGAGWTSIYVPEIVSRGLVPEDLGSFYKQQLKWARGVFEVTFVELPRLWSRLTWRQKLSYGTIGTYYLFGFTTLAYLVIPYAYLWTGVQPASMKFTEFVAYAGAVGVLGVAIYLYIQRWLCDPTSERGLHWRGMVLKMACWPVFLAGTVYALVRKHIPYIPTAKEAVRGAFFALSRWHLAVLAVYGLTLLYLIAYRIGYWPLEDIILTSEAVWGMMLFASIAALMALGAIYAAWTSTTLPKDQPWDDIDPDTLP